MERGTSKGGRGREREKAAGVRKRVKRKKGRKRY